MAKNDVVQMPKKEKSADVNSLGDFLIKNKVVLIIVACVILVGLIGFTVFEKVSVTATSKGLEQIDKAEYVLLKGSSILSEEEISSRYDDALKAVEPYVSKGGIVGARALMLKAEIYFRKSNFEGARDSYVAAAKKVKGSYLVPVCYFNAASSCEELRDNSKALEYYELAANDKEFPDPTRALFAVGRIKEALLDYVGAKEAYEKITSKNNSSDPWSNLAKSRILSMQIDGKVE